MWDYAVLKCAYSTKFYDNCSQKAYNWGLQILGWGRERVGDLTARFQRQY